MVMYESWAAVSLGMGVDCGFYNNIVDYIRILYCTVGYCSLRLNVM